MKATLLVALTTAVALAATLGLIFPCPIHGY